ncbi:MAG: CsgG/HfaB family protein [Deferribacteraceae bacterium]|jgi:hypothetical protein|nr:CsgG/HfaB family protein [Deferribacteraceae bacterium]
MFKYLVLLFSVLCIVACGSLDPLSMGVESADQEQVEYPPECEKHYDQKAKLIVAVTEYINRSTIGDAQMSSLKAGIDAKGRATIEASYKTLTAQLGEFAQGAMESGLVAMGGADVVARAQMAQILKEQKFQMTLADPNTAVEFGSLLGAQYIINGTVDNINIFWTEPVDTKEASKQVGGLLGAAIAIGGAVYNVALSGWNVEATITTNVIDIETGKIVATKQAKGTKNLGETLAFPTAEQSIVGSKDALADAVKGSMKELSKNFVINGYINQLRGSKKVALVSMGKEAGLKERDRLQIYETNVITDFKTGAKKCGVAPLPVYLTVAAKHVQDDESWTSVDTSDKGQLARIKVGSIVRRVSVR